MRMGMENSIGKFIITFSPKESIAEFLKIEYYIVCVYELLLSDGLSVNLNRIE